MVDAMEVVADFPNARLILVGGGVPGKSIARLANPPTLPTDPGATSIGGCHGWGGGGEGGKAWGAML